MSKIVVSFYTILVVYLGHMVFLHPAVESDLSPNQVLCEEGHVENCCFFYTILVVYLGHMGFFHPVVESDLSPNRVLG